METFLALTLGGSILILLLVLLNRVFGKHLSSTTYYYAWLLVMLRFLLPLPGLLPTSLTVEKAQPEQTQIRAEMPPQRPDMPNELREQRSGGYEEFWQNAMITEPSAVSADEPEVRTNRSGCLFQPWILHRELLSIQQAAAALPARPHRTGSPRVRNLPHPQACAISLRRNSHPDDVRLAPSADYSA